MRRPENKALRLGVSVAPIFAELIRAYLGVPSAEASQRDAKYFKDQLLPENRQVQQLSPDELAALKSDECAAEFYIDTTPLGDGKVSDMRRDEAGLPLQPDEVCIGDTHAVPLSEDVVTESGTVLTAGEDSQAVQENLSPLETRTPVYFPEDDEPAETDAVPAGSNASGNTGIVLTGFHPAGPESGTNVVIPGDSPEKTPPDDGGGNGDDTDGGGNGSAQDVSPETDNSPPHQEDEKPLTVAYLTEVAEQADQQLVRAALTASQREFLMGFLSVTENDLQNAYSITLGGKDFFVVNDVQFIGFDADGQPVFLRTEEEFNWFLASTDAEPSVVVNWLSASPEERANIVLAEPLQEVLNNTEARIPAIRVNTWSVIDYSEMPNNWFDYYLNFGTEDGWASQFVQQGLVEHPSVNEWFVVPDARVDQFINETLPGFISELPDGTELRFISPDGDLITTTASEMKQRAPQIIVKVVSADQFLPKFPESVIDEGISVSTAVELNADDNVATVFVMCDDAMNPYSSSQSMLYVRGQLAVFTRNAEQAVQDNRDLFFPPLIPRDNDPDRGIWLLVSQYELDVSKAAFNFVPQFSQAN